MLKARTEMKTVLNSMLEFHRSRVRENQMKSDIQILERLLPKEIFESVSRLFHPTNHFNDDPLGLSRFRDFPRWYPAVDVNSPPDYYQNYIDVDDLVHLTSALIRQVRITSYKDYRKLANWPLPSSTRLELAKFVDFVPLIDQFLGNEKLKFVFIAGIINRFLFKVIFGTGWFWEGIDDHLSSSFRWDQELFRDQGKLSHH